MLSTFFGLGYEFNNIFVIKVIGIILVGNKDTVFRREREKKREGEGERNVDLRFSKIDLFMLNTVNHCEYLH